MNKSISNSQMKTNSLHNDPNSRNEDFFGDLTPKNTNLGYSVLNKRGSSQLDQYST
jgi:hypothetical protein